MLLRENVTLEGFKGQIWIQRILIIHSFIFYFFLAHSSRSIIHSFIFYFFKHSSAIKWRRHKINENVKISIVGPFQLSVIVWKCYARGF